MARYTFDYDKIRTVQALVDGGMLMTRAAAAVGLTDSAVHKWRRRGLITVPTRPIIAPPPPCHVSTSTGLGGWWCGCGFRGVTSADLRNHRQQCRG